MKKIVLLLCVTLFLCGCSRSGPQDSPAEQDTTPSHHYHYTGYYYA
ncbi:hypothetical protein [uncultured Campylobacter sp.]|nr:hypothetical protein [uncultured Campylobacter sp.]